MSDSGLDPKERKEQFVQAATHLERLRQRVDSEREFERLWDRRAELARSQGRSDLAEQAAARAAEHRERAGYLEAELIDQQADVEELRQATRAPQAPQVDAGALLASMGVDAAEAELGHLEREAGLDSDLSELKARMGKTAPRPASENPPAEGGTS